MTAKNIAAHVAGAALVISGFLWLYLDVRPDGHVERLTAWGVALLVSAGWFLVDKTSLAAFSDFIIEKAKALLPAGARAGGAS